MAQPLSINERILDRQVSHAIGLERLSAGTVRELLALLAELDDDLMSELHDQIGVIAARMDGKSLRRAAHLEQLRTMVRELSSALREANRRNFLRAGRRLRSELLELASYEVGFQQALVKGVGVPLTLARPSVEQLAAIVESKPFQGLILRDWVSDLAAGRMRRLRTEIQKGFIAGEGIAPIFGRVRKEFQKTSPRHVETWIRSAVGHVANDARDALAASNADLIRALIWVSTLDLRTTDLCFSRDGEQYDPKTYEPLSGGPEWGAGPGRIHGRCRATSSFALKSWRALGFKARDLTPEMRASMDGLVPAKLTMGAWAARQTNGHLDRLIGRERRRLVREGGLTMKDLFRPRRGDFWNVAELRAREPEAFKRIGRAA